jgi:uncharacterized protein YeaC (DUF1315 family)
MNESVKLSEEIYSGLKAAIEAGKFQEAIDSLEQSTNL